MFFCLLSHHSNILKNPFFSAAHLQKLPTLFSAHGFRRSITTICRCYLGFAETISPTGVEEGETMITIFEPEGKLQVWILKSYIKRDMF